MRFTKLTDRKIREVKSFLKDYVPGPTKHSQRYTLSLHDISKKTGVSYYTVWCIKEGKYDTNSSLQNNKKPGVVKKGFFNVDELWDWLIGGKRDDDSNAIRRAA